MLAALEQARKLFPFPLLGIDTDSGAEFLNAELITYCEQEKVTFTRGRSGVKNDQAHVEQKNGAVVREAVGCVRLEGVQAYHQLREVYRALRLVVNCFQPSLKLQAKIPQGDRVRRVYDVARTPLQRLLASGVLPEDRQQLLRERVEQLDPLALSEHLDALRYALWYRASLSPVAEAAEPAWPLLDFSLQACCTSVLRLPTEEEPERTGHQEAPSSCEEIPVLVQAHPETRCLAPDRAISASMEARRHDLKTIRPPRSSTGEEPWPLECINTLSQRRGASNPAGIAPSSGARGVCPAAARLSTPRLSWRAERRDDSAQPGHPLALVGHGTLRLGVVLVTHRGCGSRQGNGDHPGKKGTKAHPAFVSRRAARPVRLSGPGASHIGLGARGARGA